jgi:hypothetical protein
MYTLYMALHIDNSAVEQKVREMALVAGESITESIGIAAEQRLAHFTSVPGAFRDPDAEEILTLVRSFKLRPIENAGTEDEILGYGADGHCV